MVGEIHAAWLELQMRLICVDDSNSERLCMGHPTSSISLPFFQTAQGLSIYRPRSSCVITYLPRALAVWYCSTKKADGVGLDVRRC